jgi:hypothetical protein
MGMQPLWRNNMRAWAGTLALALGILILGADIASGPHVRGPVLFAFPVVVAGWHGFAKTAMSLATVLPAVRFVVEATAWRVHVVFPEAVASGAVGIAALVGLAFLAGRAGLAQRLRERVKILEGILPICAFCKRIRDKEDRWQSVERYISDRSQAAFSHGLCPDCAKKHYPDAERRDDKPA